jgi:hypothetical protein
MHMLLTTEAFMQLLRRSLKPQLPIGKIYMQRCQGVLEQGD